MCWIYGGQGQARRGWTQSYFRCWFNKLGLLNEVCLKRLYTFKCFTVTVTQYSVHLVLTWNKWCKSWFMPSSCRDCEDQWRSDFSLGPLFSVCSCWLWTMSRCVCDLLSLCRSSSSRGIWSHVGRLWITPPTQLQSQISFKCSNRIICTSFTYDELTAPKARCTQDV